MKIKSIEPTPSPHTMKVILDEELPKGSRNNYKKDQLEGAPKEIQNLFEIKGIKGVYHVADFLAIERNPKADWKLILPKVRIALGEKEEKESLENQTVNEHYGEVKVFVQMFKGIPMQLKLMEGDQETRHALSKRFIDSAYEAQLPGDNIVLQRKWVDKGVRYGEVMQIIQELVEEINAIYPDERLQALVHAAKNSEQNEGTSRYRKVTVEDLENEDWKYRYAALEQMADPDISDLPVLEKALKDEKPAIRRLAVVYLGMIKDKVVLPYVYVGLHDKNVTVRRTAGDVLSDLGFPEAIDEMIKALKDSNRLVRWRAAMFLYEVGDERALPALKDAENDPEFEVALQIKMAIERIESGQEASGSIWKQMTEARKNSNEA